MPHLKLLDEVGQFCVALEDGETVYRKTLRNLVFSQEPVVIDFAGVSDVTTAFLSGIIHQFFQIFNSESEFRSRVQFINTTDLEIDVTIKRCLEHSLKFFTDPEYRKRLQQISDQFADGGSF